MNLTSFEVGMKEAEIQEGIGPKTNRNMQPSTRKHKELPNDNLKD